MIAVTEVAFAIAVAAALAFETAEPVATAVEAGDEAEAVVDVETGRGTG
jgi:hypothetical protein